MLNISDLPRITVVTPSYNQGKYIEETIKSVINQDYVNLEYFIVDGGSSDNSIEIIKKYESKIDWWTSEKDRGQSDAIEKGIKLATGDYITWINSDDMFLPGALQKIGEFVNSHKQADVVMGAMLLGSADGKVGSYYMPSKSPKWCMDRGAMDLLQPSTFFRRTTWLEIGGLRLELHCRMDADILHRLHLSGAIFCYINSPLSFLRLHHERKGFKGSTWQENYKKERIIWKQENRFNYIELILARWARIIQKILTGVYLQNYLGTKKYRHYKVQELWQLITN
jgi:glycosyltransferase involved in cell wall biosynthesis